MQRLLTHPGDKILLSRMIDQSFRSHNPQRVADQLRSLLRRHGAPQFFNLLEKGCLRLFAGISPRISALIVPAMIDQMRSGSSRAIIPGEPETLRAHLHKRREQGVRMNINHLGEAVLGEREAAQRLATYVKDMEDPDVEYISIKISTLYSQISSLAFDDTVAVLKQRLAAVYRAAKNNFFTRPDGSRTPKFVNLDMEEYRDLAITYQVFVETLEQEEFTGYSAGIVLQAYLPDSFAIQRQLTDWARERVARGGAPIKLRIVKGANMEMEQLESSLYNWPLAPYDNKLDVDANYKRMVGLRHGAGKHQGAVNLGVASHNLFELAYARKVAEGQRRHRRLSASKCSKAWRITCAGRIQEHDGRGAASMPRLPAKDQFINAIGYLIRRLDENTAPENFLRYAPHLQVGSTEWRFLKEGFLRSCAHLETARQTPNRVQNRMTETFAPEISTACRPDFVNEADTDWALAANRRWAEEIRERWMRPAGAPPMDIPLAINGELLFADRALAECRDPNQGGTVIARHALATVEDARLALETAAADPDGWRALSAQERHAALARAAMELRTARADLIGAAAADTGKVFAEADVEVSEAIDFAEFYPHAAAQFDHMANLETVAKARRW